MDIGQFLKREVGVKMDVEVGLGTGRQGARVAAACLGMVLSSVSFAAMSSSGESAHHQPDSEINGTTNLPPNAASGDGNAPSQEYGNTASVAVRGLEQRTPQRYLSPRALSRELSQPDAPAYAIDAQAPAGPLTLNRAVSLAVSRHPSIADAVSQVAQADGLVTVARAGYFPQVTAGFGNGNNSLTGSGKTTSLQVSQMIYDFGKTSGAVDQARATVKRQQAMTLKEVQSIEQQTAEAVVNAHRYQMLLDIATQQVEAVKKVYEMSKLRANAGVSTRSDPIQAETRVQSAEANLIQVRAQYQAARQRLRTLLGGPFNGELADLPDGQASLVQLEPSPDTSLVPDVLAAQADAVVAQDELSVAKANRLPTVSLDYTINKNLTGLNASTYVRHGSDHTVMVNLSWTMYNGGALGAQVKSATYALDAARSRVEVARLNSSDIARGFRELALGMKDRMSVMNSRKQSIDEARNLYREQYKLGTRSILDLLNAEQEYYQAASEEEAVQHDYWMALIGYVGATGTGNEFYGLDANSVAQMELRP